MLDFLHNKPLWKANKHRAHQLKTDSQKLPTNLNEIMNNSLDLDEKLYLILR